MFATVTSSLAVRRRRPADAEGAAVGDTVGDAVGEVGDAVGTLTDKGADVLGCWFPEYRSFQQ